MTNKDVPGAEDGFDGMTVDEVERLRTRGFSEATLKRMADIRRQQQRATELDQIDRAIADEEQRSTQADNEADITGMRFVPSEIERPMSIQATPWGGARATAYFGGKNGKSDEVRRAAQEWCDAHPEQRTVIVQPGGAIIELAPRHHLAGKNAEVPKPQTDIRPVLETIVDNARQEARRMIRDTLAMWFPHASMTAIEQAAGSYPFGDPSPATSWREPKADDNQPMTNATIYDQAGNQTWPPTNDDRKARRHRHHDADSYRPPTITHEPTTILGPTPELEPCAHRTGIRRIDPDGNPWIVCDRCGQTLYRDSVEGVAHYQHDRGTLPDDETSDYADGLPPIDYDADLPAPRRGATLGAARVDGIGRVIAVDPETGADLPTQPHIRPLPGILRPSFATLIQDAPQSGPPPMSESDAEQMNQTIQNDPDVNQTDHDQPVTTVEWGRENRYLPLESNDAVWVRTTEFGSTYTVGVGKVVAHDPTSGEFGVDGWESDFTRAELVRFYGMIGDVLLPDDAVVRFNDHDA